MGILNITPDSFADGGEHFSLSDALVRAEEMIAEGVDIIDIGGESTRPGAERVSEAEERRRVLPVMKELSKLAIPISIDTTRSSIARECISLGASYVNDVSGGLADPHMAPLIAESGAKYVVMHWRGHSSVMMANANYVDVVAQVREELQVRTDSLLATGIQRSQIIIDPGLGFAKQPEHNWELLRGVHELNELDFPILVGASRKRFLGEGLDPKDRESASVAITSFCAAQGIWAVRTHSVKPHKEAIAQVAKLQEALHG